MKSPGSFAVAAMYRFTPLVDHAELRMPLAARIKRAGITGSLLLASEGINGTLAGTPAEMEQFVDWLERLRWGGGRPFEGLDVKWSRCDAMPFRRPKVRLKREIVTMGVAGIDPVASVGTYVEPADWNRLIDDPDVLVIDTRNDYETAIGSFEGAIDPGTESFRQLPGYVEAHLDPVRHRRVAMYCTGGIRCEKSTALLRQRGFEDVYHLRGGILNYLETVPPEDSRWRGECFVFDDRVSVDHQLRRGSHQLCHGCGWAVPAADLGHPNYEHGVVCPRCAGQTTDQQRRRRRTRQRQIEVASGPPQSFPPA